jgi:hypothetical protein
MSNRLNRYVLRCEISGSFDLGSQNYLRTTVKFLLPQKKWVVESGATDTALIDWLASIPLLAQQHQLDDPAKRTDPTHTGPVLKKVSHTMFT